MYARNRVIAHIDADCFFASVELRDFPHLKGKPVLVCSRTDRRGIVLAATYEARPFGIRAGTPIFKAQTLCPQAHILKSHFSKYSLISKHMMKIMADFSPDIQVCSVDEAYLDLTGTELMHNAHFEEIALRIQKRITDELNITVSIGLAPTKTLAKIGSDFRKPNGLTIITERNREDFLHPMAVEKIAGVGRNTKVLLNKYGIYTIGHMFEQHELVSSLLGKHGRELLLELSGTVVWPVHQNENPQKSLSHTSTFHDFLTDEKAIFDYSLGLLKQTTHKLRSRGLEAQSFSFFLMRKDFKSAFSEHTFDQFCNDDESYLKAFKGKMFPECFSSGLLYRKSGFCFPFVRPRAPQQYSLFDLHLKNEKKTRFSYLIDGLRKRFPGTIVS